jgi:DNA-directed RNA polymerase subunit RPC12/RpoP
MPLTVPCLRCKTKFQVPSKFAGQKVRCTQCGCVLRLPSKEVIQAKKQAIASGTSSTAKTTASTKQSQSPSNDVLDIVDMYEEAPASGQAPAAGSAGAAAEPPVLSCSHCEGLLYYDPNFAKQTVACPHCGNHLIMPEL